MRPTHSKNIALAAVCSQMATGILVSTDAPAKLPEAEPEQKGFEQPISDSKYALIAILHGDGTIQVGGEIVDAAEITRLSRQQMAMRETPKLLIRVSPEASRRDLKRLTKAAAKGGLKSVVFSAYGKK